MKNVQKITLAAVLAIATSADALPKCLTFSKPAFLSELSIPAMPARTGKNALIATAAVAAVGGLYVAYNKGLISKAALAIQDVVTTHPRKTAAVLVTATALVVANHFGYLDGAKDAITSLFKKAEVKVAKDAANIEDAANVVDNAGSKIDTSVTNEAPKVPSEGSGNDANVKPGTPDAVILDTSVLNNAINNTEVVELLKDLKALTAELAKSNSKGNAEMIATLNELIAVLKAGNAVNTAEIVAAVKDLGLKNNAEVLAALKQVVSDIKADNAVHATEIFKAVTDMGNSVVAKVKDIFAALKTAPVLSDNSQIGL